MDPLEFLFSLERLGMKFGLENMHALCAALDHPEHAFRSIIVGGTNGKGSVTAMATQALAAAGYRTARYTSPHLQRLEERFVIDGHEVSTEDLRHTAGAIQRVVGQLLEQGVLPASPTFFECTTAIAFELFRRAGVSIAVLEVGLGGRLDATNVVTPIAAVITSIDFDHQAQLGNDLASIAAEKAGIIKPGVPVVCGPLPAAAERVMEDAAAKHHAPMTRALDRVHIVSRIEKGETFAEFRTPSRSLPELRLALPGRHQIANAAIVVSLADELGRLAYPVPDEAVVSGLSETTWPARLERVRWQDADVLIDAAHNPAGARALSEYLGEIGWMDATLVVGAMRDKDAAGILDPLLPRMARVICTTADSPRALASSELAALVGQRGGRSVRVEDVPDPAAALRAACQPGSHVVVAGSIFLVGPLRGILR
jgi:dihydrofolate synthase/folylpolyglutamate synthase